MPPISSRPIWFETPKDLAVRWHREQTEAVAAQYDGRPAKALARAQERADKVIAHGRIVPMRAIKTAREWQTRWEPEAAMKMLREVAGALGHSVVVHRGHGRGVGEELLRVPGGKAIILDEPALLAMAEIARREGLSLPLTARDMHSISLAGEVHACLSEDMGGPALPWVHELAEPLFVQKVLGLPFSPMVWRFLPRSEATGRRRG